MAYTFFKDLIVTGSNGAPAFFKLKEMLKDVSIGWQVMASGDGVSAYDASDVLLNNSSGINGFNNANAWFRIRMPAVDGYNRELLIQRGASAANWSIKYSHSAGFITGGNISTAPTAADQVTVQATSSTSIPANVSYCFVVGGSGENYSFIMWGADNAQVTRVFFALDRISPSIPGDGDPYAIWMLPTSSNNMTASQLSSTSSGAQIAKAWFPRNPPGESFVGLVACQYGSSMGVLNVSNGIGFGVNSFTGQSDVLPIILARTTSFVNPRGIKGISSMLRWVCSSSSFGELFTVSSFGDNICIGDCIIPWDGTVKDIYS